MNKCTENYINEKFSNTKEYMHITIMAKFFLLLYNIESCMICTYEIHTEYLNFQGSYFASKFSIQ